MNYPILKDDYILFLENKVDMMYLVEKSGRYISNDYVQFIVQDIKDDLKLMNRIVKINKIVQNQNYKYHQ